MSYDVYSVRDYKVGFSSLTLDSNDDTAIRNFAFSLSSGVLRFASVDYALYKIGSFDLISGVFTPFPVPVHVISGPDALKLSYFQE